jgi:sugar lactone lactonase YvrE
MAAELFIQARAELGEGPVWDARTQTLYWLDIYGKRLHVHSDGAQRSLALQATPGCLAPRADGRLVLAMGKSIVDLDPVSGEQRALHTFDSEPASNRFNDGKCDPAGRFLVGTMDNNEEQASGSLYSFDAKIAAPLLTHRQISNGLAWSPDHKTLYYIDSPTCQVQAFDYDVGTGLIANGRTVIDVPDSLGWPDGMTSDKDGNVWIAIWGGAQVTKWDPRTGRLLEQFPVLALQTSSCTFGGPDLNELFITSARKGMSAEQLKQYPLSGSVFRLKTGVTGMPTFEFRD